MLPIEIQMQIDISAQHHSREVAEGFAKLRERLLSPVVTLADFMRERAHAIDACYNMGIDGYGVAASLWAMQNSPYTQAQLANQSSGHNPYNSGGISGSGLWPW